MTENKTKQQYKDLKAYMGKRIMIDKDIPDGEFLGGLCGKVVGYHNRNCATPIIYAGPFYRPVIWAF